MQQSSMLDEAINVREKKNDPSAMEQVIKTLITSQMRSPYVNIEEGIVELVKPCLLSDQRGLCNSALCGHVDHFESLPDNDLGWGCGWRNIQILCSFLLSEDYETKEALFNGAGFVPDIPALQRWLEVAWMKGFDVSGAEYFNWEIYKTRKWIGTTECAALLRSFGVRAMIVSFTALSGDQSETAVGGLSGAGGGESEPDKGHGRPIPKENSSDDKKDETKVELKFDDIDETNESQPTRQPNINFEECGQSSSDGTTRKDLLNEDFEFCCKCMEKVRISEGDSHIGGDGETHKLVPVPRTDVSSTSNSDGAKRNEEEESEVDILSEIGPSFNDDIHWGIRFNMCGGSRYRSLVNMQKLPATRVPTEFPALGGNDVQMRDNKAGSGEKESSWQQADKSINHHHLIEWVWNYFSGESSYGSHSGTRNPREPVVMSNRSPLYFQYQGHSRTIIGIEHRQISDNSEEINLLVLDPCQSTEDLAKTLRERSGWREVIGRDVHSLKDSEYQICYAERGIAHGEELDNLKVLSSLNYSFYAPVRIEESALPSASSWGLSFLHVFTSSCPKSHTYGFVGKPEVLIFFLSVMHS